MQVTIDIPDETYQQLEAIASAEKVTVATVVADRLRKLAGLAMSPEELARRYPLIRSRYPDTLTSEKVAEFDLFDPS